jgi:U3 small nucleolar RNA-associated protein 4
VLPLKELGREHHRTLPNLPHSVPLISARKSRFLVSWWDREVHIWLLKESFNDLYSSGDLDSNLKKNRILLKKLFLKGESNITSATVNDDGTVLFVSTVSEVKAWRLIHDNPAVPTDVKIIQAKLPERYAYQGATKLQISPDGQWLCLIKEGNKACIIGIPGNLANSTNDQLLAEQKPQNLRRIRRNIPKHIILGGLGTYDRSITHISFSLDSKLLAVADLAGYIDTWVLRGHAIQTGVVADDSSEASSASESSDASESEDSMAKSDGERWIRNPRAASITKLPSLPVALSFSPAIPSSSHSSTHPANGEAPSDVVNDYTLLAITTSWHILEFHPLQGVFTSWTRRNPLSRLPEVIKDTRDVAKGLLWQNRRIWIYGISFLFMLDLSQDLPPPKSNPTPTDMVVAGCETMQTPKRKRPAFDSGAGSKMHIGSITAQKVERFTMNGTKPTWEDVDMDSRSTRDVSSGVEDIDDDHEREEAEPSGELAQLRDREKDEYGADEKKRWWSSFMYRPILGMVRLGNAADEASHGFEVALVERPVWEDDLPDRYIGPNER